MNKSSTKIKIRVLIVCEYYFPHIGGAEKLLYLHTKFLGKDDSFDFRVVTSQQNNTQKIEKLDNSCVVYRYPWPQLFGHPIAKMSDLKQHAEWADVIHTVMYTTAIQSLIIAKFFRKPVILTVFEVLRSDWFKVVDNVFSAFLFWFYELLLLKMPFTKLHAISNHTYSRMSTYVKDTKTLMIYPFVEMLSSKKLIKIPYHDYFLFFGRAGKTKGLSILLSAIEKLVIQGSRPVFILIVGNHPKTERQAVEKKIYKLGLSNIVLLRSQSQEVLYSYIKSAKAVVVPSITEGFGYSAYEASALGTPVIYSSKTSLFEVVKKGLEFKNGDSDNLTLVISKFMSRTETKENAISINNSTSARYWQTAYSSVI